MTYISNTSSDQQELLQAIGVSSIESLFSQIPAGARLSASLNLPNALSELELNQVLTDLSEKNDKTVSFLGAGSYRHYIPAVVPAITSRSEFYTAYTPYQPEISQGTLQAIFEYQSMICDLTHMDVTNASMYDGATALAEAMMIAAKMKPNSKILVSTGIHPHYRQVLNTYAKGIAFIEEIPCLGAITDLNHLKNALTPNVSAVLIQCPNFFGSIEDLAAIREIAKSCLLVTSTTEVLSWGFLKPFGDFGVDIVTGEGQSFGNPMNFGGPGLGIFAAKSSLLRQIPGRLVGETTDVKGNRSYVLTLSAREQHIRREKASSNICSNEGLCALTAAVYLATLGSQLQPLAVLNHNLAYYFYQELQRIPGVVAYSSAHFFNEFVLKLPKVIREKLTEIEIGIHLESYFQNMEDYFLICCTELNSKQEIDACLSKLK